VQAWENFESCDKFVRLGFIAGSTLSLFVSLLLGSAGDTVGVGNHGPNVGINEERRCGAANGSDCVDVI
jgi:hypothetical protein